MPWQTTETKEDEYFLFAAKNSLKQLYSALNSDIPCTRVLLFVKKVTNVQNCRAWIVLEKILVVNTTSYESRLLRRKKVQPKSYPLFGLIATVFNFCFSPCSTIRDYLEEGSTSLPFYFTPIWQVKLVTIISINDLSFFSEYAKNYPVSWRSVTFPLCASVGRAVETW